MLQRIMDAILILVGVSTIAFVGLSYADWYTTREANWSRIMDCEEKVREDYREAGVPLTMDHKELWMSCAEEVQSASKGP